MPPAATYRLNDPQPRVDALYGTKEEFTKAAKAYSAFEMIVGAGDPGRASSKVIVHCAVGLHSPNHHCHFGWEARSTKTGKEYLWTVSSFQGVHHEQCKHYLGAKTVAPRIGAVASLPGRPNTPGTQSAPATAAGKFKNFDPRTGHQALPATSQQSVSPKVVQNQPGAGPPAQQPIRQPLADAGPRQQRLKSIEGVRNVPLTFADFASSEDGEVSDAGDSDWRGDGTIVDFEGPEAPKRVSKTAASTVEASKIILKIPDRRASTDMTAVITPPPSAGLAPKDPRDMAPTNGQTNFPAATGVDFQAGRVTLTAAAGQEGSFQAGHKRSRMSDMEGAMSAADADAYKRLRCDPETWTAQTQAPAHSDPSDSNASSSTNSGSGSASNQTHIGDGEVPSQTVNAIETALGNAQLDLEHRKLRDIKGFPVRVAQTLAGYEVTSIAELKAEGCLKRDLEDVLPLVMEGQVFNKLTRFLTAKRLTEVWGKD